MNYNKFMRYSRRGKTELSILKDADAQQARESRFVPLVIDGRPETGPGIVEVRVRFTNGLELVQGEGDIDELFGMIRKILDSEMVTKSNCRAI